MRKRKDSEIYIQGGVLVTSGYELCGIVINTKIFQPIYDIREERSYNQGDVKDMARYNIFPFLGQG